MSARRIAAGVLLVVLVYLAACALAIWFVAAISPETAASSIHRSEAARDRFMRATGYPHGRSGWIVDHIVPLASGGCDCPENMQWQTVADARCKDRWERYVPPATLIRLYGRGRLR